MIALDQSGITTGNCTWSYTNKHGNWVAYFDWNFNPLGDQGTIPYSFLDYCFVTVL